MNSEENSRIAKNLSWLLNKFKTNPNALQQITNIPQPTIHRILSGESKDPRTSTLQPLARYFGISVSDLRDKDLANEETRNPRDYAHIQEISPAKNNSIPEKRTEKLKALIDQAGGLAKFARMYDGVDATYLSQLLNGYRNFGEKSARNMEARIGLPQGWFDHNAEQLHELPAITDPYIKEIVTLLENMDAQGKIEALGAIKVIATSYQKNNYRKNRA